MSLIEASIFRAKKISLETLRQTKTAKNEKIIPFTFTYNPKNLKVFPKIKQNVDNFQYSKTMSNVFQRKKLTKHLVLVGYSAGLNLNNSTKITK